MSEFWFWFWGRTFLFVMDVWSVLRSLYDWLRWIFTLFGYFGELEQSKRILNSFIHQISRCVCCIFWRVKLSIVIYYIVVQLVYSSCSWQCIILLFAKLPAKKTFLFNGNYYNDKRYKGNVFLMHLKKRIKRLLILDVIWLLGTSIWTIVTVRLSKKWVLHMNIVVYCLYSGSGMYNWKCVPLVSWFVGN